MIEETRGAGVRIQELVVAQKGLHGSLESPGSVDGVCQLEEPL